MAAPAIILLPAGVVYDAPVDRLRACCNPFYSLIWPIGAPVTRDEVRLFVRHGLLQPPGLRSGDRNTHIARIAWFVVNPCSDPLAVDVGVPQLGYYPVWMITDGNHRFAAALVRGDRTISARVSGSASYAREIGLVDYGAASADR